MSLSKRLYLAIGLVAVIALAFSAVTLTSRLTSAQSPDPTPGSVACDQQDGADDATEGAKIKEADDTDSVDEQCGDQNAADDANSGTETVVPCSDPTGANDATEAHAGPDTDNIQEQCGPQDETDVP